MSVDDKKVVKPLSERSFYYDDDKRGVSRKVIAELLPIVNDVDPTALKILYHRKRLNRQYGG